MSSYWSKCVKCPFYHRENIKGRKIICDGLCDNSVLESIFKTQNATKKQLQDVCSTYDYRGKCYIALAHFLKAEK